MAHLLNPLLFVLVSHGAAMTVEEPPFIIEAQTAQYDIRKYEATVVAETRIEAGFAEAGNRGFRILADYIFGNNQSRTKLTAGAFASQKTPAEKIAMTAPVNLVQSPWGFLVQFTMPATYTLASLPKPNDDRVHLREIPARRIAVTRYSGSWSEANYQEHRGQLLSALKTDGIRTYGETTFARFNSPFQLWFLRRNEIWIEVKP
jgi:hypothetical protein